MKLGTRKGFTQRMVMLGAVLLPAWRFPVSLRAKKF
jgi:hypothetical protein